MKIVFAIDSFKGSLSSVQAGEAAAEGVHRVFPRAACVVRPLADGGEGTVDALTAGLGGELRRVTVTGPAGRPVACPYGVIGDTAVLEMAGAAGITLVSGAARNPLRTTTFGVGEVIRDALAQGCRRFVVGIGGSATNDGGAGMLQALGFRLLDADGRDIPRGGAGLARLVRIVRDDVPPELSACVFQVACDVTNPLCGPNGASAVFGPQKGATPEMVATLDAALAHFADIVEAEASRRDAETQRFESRRKEEKQEELPQILKLRASAPLRETPGAGAAGGLGFAFKAFLGAELKRGVDLVLEVTDFERYAAAADVVVTGEGRLDAQTVMGKAPIGVARAAKKYDKPVIAFSGCVTPDARAVNGQGIDAFFPILRTVGTLEEALDVDHAADNLSDTAEQVFRCLRLSERFSD